MTTCTMPFHEVAAKHRVQCLIDALAALCSNGFHEAADNQLTDEPDSRPIPQNTFHEAAAHRREEGRCGFLHASRGVRSPEPMRKEYATLYPLRTVSR